MIIESGVIIFLGMLLLGIKLKAKTSLTLLGYPLALDFSVSAVAFFFALRNVHRGNVRRDSRAHV